MAGREHGAGRRGPPERRKREPADGEALVPRGVGRRRFDLAAARRSGKNVVAARGPAVVVRGGLGDGPAFKRQRHRARRGREPGGRVRADAGAMCRRVGRRVERRTFSRADVSVCLGGGG